MMEQDALNDIINTLQDGYTGWYTDLHHEVFNTDFYMADNETAQEILGDNVYNAIGRIYEYEKDNFGEIYTDLSSPMQICNMLYYIIGEEAMYEIPFEDIVGDYWNEDSIEEINEELAKAYREYLETNF